MTPEQWRRIDELYHSALSLTGHEREAFLAKACIGDPALRAEIESLLRHASHGLLDSALPAALAREAFADESLVGRQVGGYRVDAVIGAGGMGVVYRAHDSRLGRVVAIKVLPSRVAADEERTTRFDREARVLAALNHPNIATIHGMEENAELRAIVMEFVDGVTLEERLTRGPIDLKVALAIAEQLAQALDAAHEKGIVHRDLKPANIKITPHGVVKVLDFGLAREARVADLAATETMTQPGAIVGTAAYMSPEQARGQSVDKRADIWSFGCVLFEMLAGRRPFEGPTVSDVIAKVLTQEPDFTALPADSPPAIRQLLQRCMEKDRNHRLRDIGDAHVDLRYARSPGSEPRDGAPARARRGWQTAMAAVAVAVVAVTFLIIEVDGARWFDLRPSPAAATRLTLATSQPLTFTRVRGVAMSPDGTRYTYVTTRGFVVGYTDGRPELHRHEAAGVTDIFFSPDGEWIGYSDGNALFKFSLAGGEVVTLATTAPGATAAWGSDGIVFADANGLFRLAAEGGPPEPLPMRPLETNEQAGFPELLPDGRTVLITVLPFRTAAVRLDAAESPQARIEAVDLQSGTRKTILRNGGAPRLIGGRYLAYLAGRQLKVVAFDIDRVEALGEPLNAVPTTNSSAFGGSSSGSLIYLSASGVPDTEPVWVDGSGRQEPLGAPVLPYVYPELSPDGTRVAFVVVNRTRGDRDVWLWDIARKVMSQPIDDRTDNATVAWSPDSRRLAFGSARDKGVVNTYWQAIDGSSTGGRIARSSSTRLPVVFTLDRRLLLSVDVPGEGRNLVSASLDKDNDEVKPLVGGPGIQLSGDLSPDGKWLAYDATDSGRFEVYVRPYPDVEGGRWMVSRDGGRQPMWSPDGKALFYRDFAGAVMSVSVMTQSTFRPGAPSRVLDGADFLGSGAGASSQSYAVGKDGRFLMLKHAEPAAPSLRLILDWASELSRLIPR